MRSGRLFRRVSGNMRRTSVVSMVLVGAFILAAALGPLPAAGALFATGTELFGVGAVLRPLSTHRPRGILDVLPAVHSVAVVVATGAPGSRSLNGTSIHLQVFGGLPVRCGWNVVRVVVILQSTCVTELRTLLLIRIRLVKAGAPTRSPSSLTCHPSIETTTVVPAAASRDCAVGPFVSTTHGMFLSQLRSSTLQLRVWMVRQLLAPTGFLTWPGRFVHGRGEIC